MRELYKSKGLTKQKIIQILRDIKFVETDNDWDGISSAAQFNAIFPKAKINISHEKIVNSKANTLVIDKWTNEKGWIVDHHTTNPYRKANILLFSTSGRIPSSRLTYILLGKNSGTGLLVSALAEITDELQNRGLRNGSLMELRAKSPHYFLKSKIRNQFLKNEEIYIMADILAIISWHDSNYALRLARRFYKTPPKSSEDLIRMLDKRNAKLIESYRDFVQSFDLDCFEEVKILGKKVRIMDRRGLGKFYLPILGMVRRKYPGNYLLFKGNKLSIRSDDKKLIGYIFDKLKELSYDQGGRADAYGVTLSKTINYDDFKQIILH